MWSGAVSGVSPTGMTTAPGKHPVHGKVVCDGRLSAMQRPLNQYPAHNRGGMTCMTAQTLFADTHTCSLMEGIFMTRRATIGDTIM